MKTFERTGPNGHVKAKAYINDGTESQTETEIDSGPEPESDSEYEWDHRLEHTGATSDSRETSNPQDLYPIQEDDLHHEHYEPPSPTHYESDDDEPKDLYTIVTVSPRAKGGCCCWH
ncbi:hypothetical protein PCASD_16322 [Puccinia coronata f. sp. avenae]|uniref:Uncharacterized protein n=1 Tax=Puccinia coronata f. sp. avenae TaxID=200324 RepID=A0A2N5TXP6_9BASI|nr:hypothetical protein PCASD_16322 [Puccinia coronata f. sp. avenae]